jgi:hypothetical protein
MTQWEYKTAVGLLGSTDTLGGSVKGSYLKAASEDDIHKLGEEGWELVAITGVSVGGSTRSVLMFFKRPKE